MSAIDDPVERVGGRRSVYAANKADLDEVLRGAMELGEAVLFVPGECRIELIKWEPGEPKIGP